MIKEHALLLRLLAGLMILNKENTICNCGINGISLTGIYIFIFRPIVTDGVFPVINFTGLTVNSVNVVKNAVSSLSANIN